MDRNEWLTIVVREANCFVEEHEAALRRALEADGDIEALGDRIDRHVRGVLLDEEDLWDLVRHSGLRDPEPSLWREAETWESVLVRVAFACFAHDLTRNVLAILEGKAPRLDPKQMVFVPREQQGREPAS